MAKGSNQKLKIMYLMKILLELTDETHSISMPEIISALEQHGITAERKSIYNDMASQHKASQLQRQVYVANRIKTMNASIYYNVDAIHAAIAANEQICFQYFQWNVRKEMELRHDGAYYHVSPWALSWDDENYYMIAYDSAVGKIKHFRVDKMLRIESTKERREGREQFREFDMAVYARKMFGMYGGREEFLPEVHRPVQEAVRKAVVPVRMNIMRRIMMPQRNSIMTTMTTLMGMRMRKRIGRM